MPHRRLPFAAAALVALAADAVPGAAADALDDLEPGCWYEVPASRLRSAAPEPEPPGYSGLASVMSAWSGAAFDESRDRLLVWGGGHADYAGNELYAFDLHTLAWSRLWGPTPSAQIPDGDGFETYLDGNPSSRHTYSGLVHVPAPHDALFAIGGSRWQNGYGTAATWRFTFADSTWTRRADHLPGSSFGDASVWDPVTGHVFHRGLNVLDEYDPATDAYVERAREDGGWWEANLSAALDPDRRRMLIAGSGTMDLFHLDTGVYESIAPPGGEAVRDASAPGLAFEPSSGRFVAWVGGTDVYTYDFDVGEWLVHAAAGGPDPGPPLDNGTFGRWRYSPGRNVFVLANGVDADVFVYRLSPGGGDPPEPPPDAGGDGDADAEDAAVEGDATGPDVAADHGGDAATDGPPDAGDEDGPGGCGCRATGTADAGWVMPAAAAWAMRRRRRSGSMRAESRRRLRCPS
ncbi:MAG: hypothetical protein JXB32_13430 [Deltaproteobacteria bacterium]|nr:hypothetical protein [Deltaproteobacteria bacterium]